MSQKVDIYKAAGIIIRDRRLLVEKSKGKNYFKAPGGKIEPGETSREALIRELKEEYTIEVKEEDFVEFGTFTHPSADGDGRVVCMEVFRVNSWKGEIVPDHEVEKVEWVSSKVPQDMRLGSIFEQEVIPRLKEANLID